MSGDEITLNLKTLKAIGAESRVSILKALGKRQKTQSELADELKLSKPAVLEHLDKLLEAGLILRLDEGRKWKYYHLSSEGKKLVERRPLNVVIALALSLIIALSSALFLWQQFSYLSTLSNYSTVDTVTRDTIYASAPESLVIAGSEQESTKPVGADDSEISEDKGLDNEKLQKSNLSSQSGLSYLLPSITIFLSSFIAIGVCMGYLLKNK